MKQFLSIALCLFCMAASTFVAAQVNRTDAQVRSAKTAAKIKKLGTGDSARVKVTLYNGTKYEGSIKSSSDVDFVMAERSGSDRTIAYSDVRSVGGSGLSKGAKIGIGVGAAVGATLIILYVAFQNAIRNN